VRAAPDSAAWGSVIAGVGSVLTLPLAIYLTRFIASYELRDAAYGIPVAGGLGILAVALAGKARRLSGLRLGGEQRTGVARVGRMLGVVGICMALAGLVALAVFGLLEYAGTRN
jgi:hypothetical protein